MKWTLLPLVLPLLMLAACDGSPDPEAVGARDQPVPADPWPDLVPNATTPEAGLIGGGQPSLEQLEALRDNGIRTVVNLRGEGEPGAKASEIEALGMRYVALPIEGSEGLSEDNARAFAEILSNVERPAVVHCGSGNRVGALFALKAFYVDGSTVDEAFDVGHRAGLTRLSGDVRRHLEMATDG